jgi:hypothetical protein
MPDGAIAMSHSKTGFNHLPVNLIKEAKLNCIGCIAPDRKVSSTFGDGSAKGSWIGWKHAGILPLKVQEIQY